MIDVGKAFGSSKQIALMIVATSEEVYQARMDQRAMYQRETESRPSTPI